MEATIAIRGTVDQVDLPGVGRSWIRAKVMENHQDRRSEEAGQGGLYHPQGILPRITTACDQQGSRRHYGYEAVIPGRNGSLRYRRTTSGPGSSARASRRWTCYGEDFRSVESKRVLSLVTFGMQGAFNGVHRAVLEERLPERSVPESMVKWFVVSAASGREASWRVTKPQL